MTAPDELDRAGDVVRLFDEAVAKGAGVTVGQSGRMSDEAVVRQARRVVGLASGQAGTRQLQSERAR